MSKEHGWWDNEPSPEYLAYLAEQERLRRERALAAAWGEADELESRQARLEAEYSESRSAYAEYRDGMAEWGRPPVRPVDARSPRPVQRYVRRLRRHCLTMEGRLKRHRRKMEGRRRQQDEARSFLLGGLEARPLGTSEAGPAEPSVAEGFSESELSGMEGMPRPEDGPSGPAETAEAPADAAARDARRLVDRLSAEVPAADRSGLEELAARIGAEEREGRPARAGRMLLELRLGVQRANDRVEEAKVEADRHLADAVEDLRERIRGFRGEEVEAISAELDRVERRRAALDDGIADRVEAVVRSGRERDDQRYVGMVMREELERLGYAVEDGFDSIFSDGGRTILRKTDEEELGVVVDVDGNAIDVEPVRVAASGRQKAGKDVRRDRDLESAWCRDFGEFRRAMAGRGVRLKVGKRFPVGVSRLKVHEGEGARKEAAAPARAQRPRRRKAEVREAAR